MYIYIKKQHVKAVQGSALAKSSLSGLKKGGNKSEKTPTQKTGKLKAGFDMKKLLKCTKN